MYGKDAKIAEEITEARHLTLTLWPPPNQGPKHHTAVFEGFGDTAICAMVVETTPLKVA